MNYPRSKFTIFSIRVHECEPWNNIEPVPKASGINQESSHFFSTRQNFNALLGAMLTFKSHQVM